MTRRGGVRARPVSAVLGVVAAAAALALVGCGADAPEATTWTIPETEECQGLTVGWPVDRGALRSLIGSELEPVEGPTPGTGTLLLFAAECTDSRIGSEGTNAFVTAHVLVPVEAPTLPEGLLPGETPPRWVAIPRTLGPVDSPVRALFEAEGFPTTEARTAFDLRPGAEEGLEASFTIATQAGGRVEVEATLADEPQPAEFLNGLVSTAEGPVAVATGRESASRYEEGTATVSLEDAAFLEGFDLGSEPPVVSLDRHFRWSFTFRSDRTP